MLNTIFLNLKYVLVLSVFNNYCNFSIVPSKLIPNYFNKKNLNWQKSCFTFTNRRTVELTGIKMLIVHFPNYLLEFNKKFIF
jgi:hypothetical protein